MYKYDVLVEPNHIGENRERGEHFGAIEWIWISYFDWFFFVKLLFPGLVRPCTAFKPYNIVMVRYYIESSFLYFWFDHFLLTMEEVMRFFVKVSICRFRISENSHSEMRGKNAYGRFKNSNYIHWKYIWVIFHFLLVWFNFMMICGIYDIFNEDWF